MKKLFIIAFLCLFSQIVKAQYSAGFGTSATTQYVYVGSLTRAEFDLSNRQKLRVDVFGGAWTSNDLGETTYLIGNREGLKVHQVTLGGSNNGFFTLQAYDNGANNIDFYVVSNGWAAFAVNAVLLEGTTEVQTITISSSTTTPAGTLHALNILPVLVTDENGNMAMKTITIDTDYALTVNGAVRAKEIMVETGWADFVFDKNYDLRPLSEVKSYIAQNHHLPDLPAASDVEKNGLKLGEINKLLTKKVEELTLYLIENDHREKEQDGINTRQKAELKEDRDRIKLQNEQLLALAKAIKSLKAEMAEMKSVQKKK